MTNFLTIGEVSNLTHLPISTLRYYDKEGIVKPYLVDENTKYRYYRLYQVAIIKMVIHLKKLGFNNKYIKEHLQNLDYNYTLNLMNEMINKTDNEIERLKKLKIELKDNIKQIEYLKNLEKKVNQFFEEELEIDSIYANIDNSDLWNSIRNAFSDLDKFLQREKENSIPLGFFAFTFKYDDILNHNYHYDKLLALRKYENYKNRYIVPKKKYICLICKGKFEKIKDNSDKLLNYIKNNNYSLSGDGIINIISGAEFQKNPFETTYILKFPVS